MSEYRSTYINIDPQGQIWLLAGHEVPWHCLEAGRSESGILGTKAVISPCETKKVQKNSEEFSYFLT